MNISQIDETQLERISLSDQSLVNECPAPAMDTWLTPSHLHYIRSHFATPDLDSAAWRLTVDGHVARPLTLSYADILDLPRYWLPVTLECAGNDRSRFVPCVKGNQFAGGALSTAVWTGARLADLLDAAGVSAAA